jgi:biopolymer transport protein TolQ
MPDAQQQGELSLDPLSLMLGSSGVVLVVLVILIVASLMVWLIWFAKSAQLRRLRSEHHQFERDAEGAPNAKALIQTALRHKLSPGGRVVLALAKQHQDKNPTSDLLAAIARRAVADEEKRASSLMPTLASIASASPFIGLFGTVWGIMNAFIRIGMEKSASLPVGAPAMGEALVATAWGVVAASPATIGFNYVERRISELMDDLAASSDVWVALLMADPRDDGGALPLIRESGRPPSLGRN